MLISTLLDEVGRPSFNSLQNHASGAPLHFFIFDLLILRGRDVMAEPLLKRRALIEKHGLRRWWYRSGIHPSLRQACRIRSVR